MVIQYSMNVLYIFFPVFRKYMMQQFPIINQIIFPINLQHITKNIRRNKFAFHIGFLRQPSRYFYGCFRNIHPGGIKTHFREISHEVPRPAP